MGKVNKMLDDKTLVCCCECANKVYDPFIEDSWCIYFDTQIPYDGEQNCTHFREKEEEE